MTATAPETQTTSPIDQALNQKGFPEFLAKYAEKQGVDKIDMTDANQAEIMEQFESFEVKSKVSTEIRTVFREHLKDLGIKLDEADFKSIDEYLDEEAIDNPDVLRDMGETVKKFKEIPQQIQQLEQQISAVGDRAALERQRQAAEEKQTKLSQAQVLNASLPRFRMFRKKATRTQAKADAQARDDILQEYNIDLHNVETELISADTALTESEGKLTTIEGLENQKASIQATFEQLNQKLFKDSELGERLQEVATTKVRAKLGQMLFEAQNVKDLDKSNDYLAKIQKIDEDYLDGLDPDELQEGIDTRLEAALGSEMKDAIEKVRDNSVTLDAIENVIKKYTTQTKMGRMQGDELKEMLGRVFESLENDNTIPLARRLLLSRSAVRLGVAV